MQKKDWQKLVDLFAHVSSPKEMEELLLLFLTPSERDCLVQRLRIIQALLTTDLPQRQVSSEVGVSIAKITAGSKELQRRSESFKKSLIAFFTPEGHL